MRADLLLRCRRPPLSRQNDQALIVTATLYEVGHFGVADRLLKVVRAFGTEAVELGDERRTALKTGSHGRCMALRRGRDLVLGVYS